MKNFGWYPAAETSLQYFVIRLTFNVRHLHTIQRPFRTHSAHCPSLQADLIPLKLSQSPQPTHSNLLTLSYPRWRHRTKLCDNHHYRFNIAHWSLPPFNDLTCKAPCLAPFRNLSYILIVLYHPFYKMSIVFLNFFQKKYPFHKFENHIYLFRKCAM